MPPAATRRTRRGHRAPRARVFDVVGVGTNTLDHVCVVPRPLLADDKAELRVYQQMPGGQIPTALVALQRWGLRTAYVGALGDDAGGVLQRASLAAAGVDRSRCRVRRGVSGATSVIIVDPISGARTVLWHQPPALTLRATELDRRLVAAARAVLLDDTNVEAALCVAAWARMAGALVMLDVDEPGPHSAALLACSDVAIVPDGFAQRATGCASLAAALRHLVARGPRLAVATLGAGGAVACRRGRLLYVPAYRVPVIDTTSAGDCFHAGCLFGLLGGWPLARTLRFAAAAAALACTTLGGRISVPELDVVLAVLEKNRRQ